MQDKKYFCYEIYKNLAVWSQNGKLGYNPCSFYNGFFKTTDTLDIDSAWSSPERAHLKHCVENDIPIPGCDSCYKEERDGLESRRQGSKTLYEIFHQDKNIKLDSPQGLDYSVGNLCNLKCVICGPHNSSQWIPDYKKLFPLSPIDKFKYKKLEQIEITDASSLKNIKNIHFHGGGEPLMSNNHINLLKKIKELKGLDDVRIFYNTNGTQLVSDEILKIWEECKLVELYFSIDDVDSRFEYQRTGADWNSVKNNLKWFYDNMPHNHIFKINCCWGYLNLYYLDELYDWWSNNFKTNRYGDHTNLIFQKAIGLYSIDHLSESAINILNNKFKNYPEINSLVNSLKKSDLPHGDFWSNISRLDDIRNTKFQETFPDWSQLLL